MPDPVLSREINCYQCCLAAAYSPLLNENTRTLGWGAVWTNIQSTAIYVCARMRLHGTIYFRSDFRVCSIFFSTCPIFPINHYGKKKKTQKHFSFFLLSHTVLYIWLLIRHVTGLKAGHRVEILSVRDSCSPNLP